MVVLLRWLYSLVPYEIAFVDDIGVGILWIGLGVISAGNIFRILHLHNGMSCNKGILRVV